MKHLSLDAYWWTWACFSTPCCYWTREMWNCQRTYALFKTLSRLENKIEYLGDEVLGFWPHTVHEKLYFLMQALLICIVTGTLSKLLLCTKKHMGGRGESLPPACSLANQVLHRQICKYLALMGKKGHNSVPLRLFFLAYWSENGIHKTATSH